MAAPIDKFMRINRTTSGAENDWSTSHAHLEALAGAYNLSANWQIGAQPVLGNPSASSNTETKNLNRGGKR